MGLDMPAPHIYGGGMSTSAQTQQMQAVEQAQAAEIRAIMARKNITGLYLAERLGVEQSWFSRRYRGKVAWTGAEIQIVMDILDDDITKVYAAGAAALAQLRKTNLCLSDSARIGDDHLTGWAARGLELAQKLYPSVLGVNAA